MSSLFVGKGLIKLKKFKPKQSGKRKSKVILDQKKLKEWSVLIRNRDGKCMSCGTKQHLHAHHIISKFYFPHLAYSLNNGTTLCRSCHIGKGGVHDKRNPPKNSKIAYLRKVFLANRPRKRKKYKRYKKRKT